MTVAEVLAADEIQATARHTDLRGFIVTALNNLLRAGLPAGAALIGAGTAGGIIVLAALGGAAAFTFALAWLQWRRLTYTTGPEDIRVEQGLLSRSARSVPYERIQDVSIEQKWLARLFGLAEVKFETGAGGKEEISLAYLTLKEGERLRELVRERKEGEAAPPAGGRQPVSAPAEVLFAMDDRRVLLFGLFEFSLILFAVLLGAAHELDFLVPADFWKAEYWQPLLAGGEQRIAGIGRAAQILALVAAVLTVVLVGILTGVVRTFAREYDFCLEHSAKGFRRRRGLLSRSDVVLPVHRVQAALVRAGIVRRRFGWHGLQFVSLAQDGAKSPHHSVAPFAQLEEIWPLVRAAGIDPPAQDTEWHRSSPRPWVYRAIFRGGFFVALGIAGGAMLASWLPLIAGAVLAAGTALLNYLGWRRHWHATDETQVFLRHGRLAPRLMVAPLVKLQSVEVVQSPLARSGEYATLKLGLAGGRMNLRGVPMVEARAIRRAVLDRISSVDFSRLGSAG